MVFVVIQGLGYLLTSTDPAWYGRLALIPQAVLHGEIWRFATFLALPITSSLIGLIFALMFGYFILNMLESEWGAAKTTIYTFISIVLMCVFAMIFDYPGASIAALASTWFLAAATLFPEQTIQLYMLIPVKMKVLGWLAAVFILWRFAWADWIERLFLVVVYLNYFLFFGPALVSRARQWQRRRAFKSRMR
jgi:hypothetical protein